MKQGKSSTLSSEPKLADISKKSRKRSIMGKNSKKRAAILHNAEKIFAENGFHEATISQIASKAQVADATIYEYFPSKEALLFAIPAEYSQEFQDGNRHILKYIKGQANKLRAIIYRLLELYQENPEYAAITTMILKSSRNFTESKEYEVIRESAKMMSEIIEDGMRNGEFKPDLNPVLVRSVMVGTIEHLTLRKALLGKPQNLIEQAEDIINILFDGIIRHPAEDRIKVSINLDGFKHDEELDSSDKQH